MPEMYHHSILIIDKDEVVRDSLRALLESYGFLVRTFRDSGEFLGIAGKPSGKCLIIGCHRHIREGLQLLRKLRNGDFDLPVIFTVGGGSDAMKAAALAAGAFAYLERPVAEDVLMQIVRRAVAWRTVTEGAPASAGAASGHGSWSGKARARQVVKKRGGS